MSSSTFDSWRTATLAGNGEFKIWWPRSDASLGAQVEESQDFNEIERLRGLEELSPLLMPPDQARKLMAAGEPPFAPVTQSAAGVDRTLQVGRRTLRARVFTPPIVTAVYLHIHGGGWCLGSARYQDERLWSLAQDAQVVVVSIDYRLAPEHPHPAGFEDCRTVASWLVESYVEELSVNRVLIGGESAGAHLAALTLIALRDRGEIHRVCGANLIFGIYDLSMTPSQRRWGSSPLILSTPILATTYARYVPGLTEDQRRDATVSPLYADLAGLPPALFTVGAADPLLDDSVFMAGRWHSAGNETALDVYPEAAHGFIAKPLGLAKLAHERMIYWMKSVALRKDVSEVGI